VTLTIELPPEVERLLNEAAAQSGQAPADVARVLLEERLMERNRGAMVLLDQWLAEEPDEEDETWPEFQAALESSHPSNRHLFDE
jgi:hypothetical protein